MNQFKKIMVCVDLSDYSKENISYALEFAGQSNVEILLYNVINQRDVDAVEKVERMFPDKINIDNKYRVNAKRYVEEVTAERYKEMKNLVETHFNDMKDSFSYLVGVGYPFEEILKTVEQKEIALVFIGTKGRGNLARTLLGSNAEKVFRHSPVPVVSIRNRNRSAWGRKQEVA
ncbi:MAG: universal stress protein [Desulfamplus sp.]|nr:universal stress protein [Desulfamplus sp.]MBF0411537.1 universal stress protein [Desulfamplus sp.]